MIVLDQLAPQILFVGAGIFGALVLASCIIFSLVKVYPNTNYSELVSRIKSWWVMASIFLVVLVIGPMGSIIFYGVLSFLALKEFLTLIPTRISDRHTLFWAYIAIPIQYYWISLKWYPMFLIFIPVYAFLFLPFRMLLSKETKGFLGSISSIHWGLMTMVFCLSHQVYLLALPNEVNPNGGAAGLLLFLVLLTESNDIMQYLWGKLLGKRKIVPEISPNKTVAGFIGGLISVVALSYIIAPILTPLNQIHALVLGGIVASTGFIGDVVVSAIKRDLEVKDSGSLIPGHGGILDRVDSLIYTAPIFFHYIHYFLL